MTPDLGLQALGIELVKVPPRAAVCQRVFQQGQQRLGIQFPDEQRRHMAQESPRRRELQRHPGAVVGQDVPPIKRRRDLPGKHPVGRDQRGLHAILSSLA